MPDHGHPISSPCEPNGSGELKMHCKPCLYFISDLYETSLSTSKLKLTITMRYSLAYSLDFY